MSFIIFSKTFKTRVLPSTAYKPPNVGVRANLSTTSHLRSLHARPSVTGGEIAAAPPPGSQTSDIAVNATGDAMELVNNASTLNSGFMHAASNAFLELPQILGGTSYAVTIVLLTVFLRSAITLPMVTWQRKRVRRVQELVVPAAKEWLSSAKYALRAEYRKANKTYEQYVATLNANAKKQFKLLAAKHKCRPLPTMLLPPLIHLPIFIGTTLTIREACTRSFTCLQTSVEAVESGAVGSVNDGLLALALESLAWCPSLADVDPYSALPVAVGITALLNVELQARIRQALAELRENVLDSADPSHIRGTSGTNSEPGIEKTASDLNTVLKRPSRPAPSIPSILRKKTFVTTAPMAAARPAPSDQQTSSLRQNSTDSTSVASAARSRAITNVLRFGSILFIPIAAASPVAVNIYWLTSNLYSLTQNLVLGYRDRSERAIANNSRRR